MSICTGGAWPNLAWDASTRRGVIARASRADPDDELALILLAATYGYLGRVKEAEFAIEQANELRRNRQQDLVEGPLRVGLDVFLVGPYTLDDVDLGRSRSRRIESGCARASTLPAFRRRDKKGSLAD